MCEGKAKRKRRPRRTAFAIFGEKLLGCKQCGCCGEVKEHALYSLSSRSVDGMSTECKGCERNRKSRRKSRGHTPSHRHRSAAQLRREQATRSKVCNSCGDVRPYAEYSRDTSSKDGLSNRCKGCTRDYMISHKYGIDPAIFHRATHCQSCGVDFDLIPSHSKVVDHCHGSARVRGIICAGCNVAEGFLTPTALRDLANYIERTETIDLRKKPNSCEPPPC